MTKTPSNTNYFVEQIKQLIREAQQSLVSSVNSIMVSAYFELGKRIVENEQEGRDETGNGEYLLTKLSLDLTSEFGKGYSKRNLEHIRKFYLTYKFVKTPFSQNIGWSHYLMLT